MASLNDQRANDTTRVLLGSLLGGVAVVLLLSLCAVVAVARVRHKRPSLDERMDTPRNCMQNNYIGLSEFDRADDSVQVIYNYNLQFSRHIPYLCYYFKL